MSDRFIVRSDIARKAPDPLYSDITHWDMWVPVSDLPLDLPAPNNTRLPKANFRSNPVYRDMSDEVIKTEEPLLFHLKNKGITLTAESIREAKRGGETVYHVILGPEDGIIDGGHTYAVLSDHLKSGALGEENDQHVKLRFIIGMDETWIPDVGEGQNSTVQVRDVSMLNARHDFDWLKDLLATQPYFDKIYWQENPQPGEVINVTDIIRYLYVVHPEIPSPNRAYANAGKVLEHYEANIPMYQELELVVDDVLRLSDYISHTAYPLWKSHSKNWFQSTVFAGNAYRSRDRFWFIDADPVKDSAGDHPVLHGGAIYPFLSTYRLLLDKPSGSTRYSWKKRLKAHGPVDPQVVWDICGYDLMEELAEAGDYGRNQIPITTLGKDPRTYTMAQKTIRLAISERRI